MAKRIFAGLLLIGISLVVLGFRLIGYENTWHYLWNISTIMPPFADLRMIPESAEALKLGYDPAIQNPFDPTHRLFNYPKIWYLILRSPIDMSWTTPLAIVCTALFFLGLVLFPARLDKYSILFLLLLTFSPAVMAGIERANVDLVFFFIVSAAIFLLDVSAIASLTTLLIGALFKIFPIFAVTYFLELDKKTALKYIISGALFTVIYFALTLPDMLRVFSTTPKGDDFSYGVTVLAQRIVNQYRPGYAFLRFRLLHIPVNIDYIQLRLISYFGVVLLIVISAYFGIRNRSCFQFGNIQNLRAFRAGAGIFIGTFLLGNNYDYRLTFLLFTIPLLSEWSSRCKSFVSRLSIALTLMACWYLIITRLLDTWLPFGDQYSFILDTASKWGLFFTMIYLFFASLPNWLTLDQSTHTKTPS